MKTRAFTAQDQQNQHDVFGGLDVDWFATDSLGQIGYFTSAGCGPIPVAIAGFRDQLSAIHDYLLKLPADRSPGIEVNPILAAPNVVVAMHGVYESYRNEILEMGRRGIFCFDADTTGISGYVRLLKPDSPLLISELPEFPRAEIASVILPCDFAKTETLQ